MTSVAFWCSKVRLQEENEEIRPAPFLNNWFLICRFLLHVCVPCLPVDPSVRATRRLMCTFLLLKLVLAQIVSGTKCILSLFRQLSVYQIAEACEIFISDWEIPFSEKTSDKHFAFKGKIYKWETVSVVYLQYVTRWPELQSCWSDFA